MRSRPGPRMRASGPRQVGHTPAQPEVVGHDPAAAGAVVQATAGASELPGVRLRLVLAAVADWATLGHADPALLPVEVHLVQPGPVPCGPHAFGHASAPFIR